MPGIRKRGEEVRNFIVHKESEFDRTIIPIKIAHDDIQNMINRARNTRL
jgi:hypothetical protein